MTLRPSRAVVFIGSGLVVLLAAVVLTAPRWTRLLTRSTGDDDAAGDEHPVKEEEPAGAVERTIKVKLFFQAPDRPGLAMEEREVPFASDIAGQLKAVVGELIRGSRSGLTASLPPETRVLEVFVNEHGVAYVDLSKEAAQGTAGSHDELLSVYSIVNSLTVNFPAIKRVQILVDDRPADTLAGHIDLSRPLPADMTLLVAAAIAPASPGPAGASPPPPVPPSPRPAAAPPS